MGFTGKMWRDMVSHVLLVELTFRPTLLSVRSKVVFVFVPT